MTTIDLLALFRHSAARYLTDRCTIERETKSTGTYGEQTRVWTLIASGVPCRLVIARRSDLSGIDLVADGETMAEFYRIALPHDTILSGDDRITVNGTVYGVIRLENALTDRVFASAILAKR